MIKAGAELKIERIPLHKLEVHENQIRYPSRLLHYIPLLQEHPRDDPGLVSVKPLEDGRYEILDGHHRFCAMVMTGRATALCLVIKED